MSEHEPSAGPKSSYEGDDTQAKSVAAEETAGARYVSPPDTPAKVVAEKNSDSPGDSLPGEHLIADLKTGCRCRNICTCLPGAAAREIERLTREVEELRGAVYSKIDPHEAKLPNAEHIAFEQAVAEIERLTIERDNAVSQSQFAQSERDRLEELTDRQSVHVTELAHENGRLRAALERISKYAESPELGPTARVYSAKCARRMAEIASEALAGAADDTYPLDRTECAELGKRHTVETDAVRCPKCGDSTFTWVHTPAGDHPEIIENVLECRTCDWSETR